VEFLEGRSMAVLAIPAMGWAILAAVAVLALARAIAKGVERDPGFRRLAPDARLAIVLALFVISWAAWNRRFYERDVRAAMWNTGQPTDEVIRQFELVKPSARPHSTVVFLNDPFDGWDMAFIAELWFRDPSVTVKLQKKTPMTAEELARAEVWDWRAGKLVAVTR